MVGSKVGFCQGICVIKSPQQRASSNKTVQTRHSGRLTNIQTTPNVKPRKIARVRAFVEVADKEVFSSGHRHAIQSRTPISASIAPIVIDGAAQPFASPGLRLS